METMEDCESLSFDISNAQFATDEFRMYDFKSGTCSRGDACTYAHGVFETWLHPSKYKTQMCSDVDNCKRLVCFFAHRPDELRVTETRPPHNGAPHINAVGQPGQNRGLVTSLPAPAHKMMSPHMSLDMMAAMHHAQHAQHVQHMAVSPQSSPTSAGDSNPFNMLLSAVQQIQATMPGVNMMQLLSAVGAGAPPPQPAPPSDLVNDLASALLQQATAHAQAQASMQMSELMRQVQCRMATGPMPPPLPVGAHQHEPLSVHSSAFYKPYPPAPRGGGVGSPPSRSSGGLSPYAIPAPQRRMPPFGSLSAPGSAASSAPHAQLSSAALRPASLPLPSAMRASRPGSFWGEGGTPPSPPALAKRCGSPPDSASSFSTLELWAGDPIWCNGAAKLSAASAPELLVDSACSSRGNSAKLLQPAVSDCDGAGDALLNALPRQLSDLQLADVASSMQALRA